MISMRCVVGVSLPEFAIFEFSLDSSEACVELFDGFDEWPDQPEVVDLLAAPLIGVNQFGNMRSTSG